MKTQTESIKHYAVQYLDERYGMIENSLNRLSVKELWEKPNPSSNSMGNLVLHLCGNIRQYIISGLGGKADTRERDREFSENPGYDHATLLNRLETVLDEAKQVILDSSEGQLLQMKEVQGFRMNGTGILFHVVEHLSYHTGQIAYYTKLVRNEDLGFYKGRNLNEKND